MSGKNQTRSERDKRIQKLLLGQTHKGAISGLVLGGMLATLGLQDTHPIAYPLAVWIGISICLWNHFRDAEEFGLRLQKELDGQ